MKQKGVDCYKVVTDNRESTCINLYLFNSLLNGEKIKNLLKEQRVIKVYKKGCMVKAAKKAGPLLCFDNRTNAREWAIEFLNRFMIIKVRGFEPETPIIFPFDSRIWKSFCLEGISSITRRSQAPDGSLGFRRIKILT